MTSKTPGLIALQHNKPGRSESTVTGVMRNGDMAHYRNSDGTVTVTAYEKKEPGPGVQQIGSKNENLSALGQNLSPDQVREVLNRLSREIREEPRQVA